MRNIEALRNEERSFATNYTGNSTESINIKCTKYTTAIDKGLLLRVPLCPLCLIGFYIDISVKSVAKSFVRFYSSHSLTAQSNRRVSMVYVTVALCFGKFSYLFSATTCWMRLNPSHTSVKVV